METDWEAIIAADRITIVTDRLFFLYVLLFWLCIFYCRYKLSRSLFSILFSACLFRYIRNTSFLPILLCGVLLFNSRCSFFSTLPPASRIPSPHTRRISPRFFHDSYTLFRIHLYRKYLSIILVHFLRNFFLSTIPQSSICIFVNHVCQTPSFPYLHNTIFDINHCQTICVNHPRTPQCFTYIFSEPFVTHFCRTTNVKFLCPP